MRHSRKSFCQLTQLKRSIISSQNDKTNTCAFISRQAANPVCIPQHTYSTSSEFEEADVGEEHTPISSKPLNVEEEPTINLKFRTTNNDPVCITFM